MLSAAILVICALTLNFLGDFCKTIPFYAGFVIPRFHLRDFLEIYSPANFKRMMENLSLNKPAFVTPSSIGALIFVYLVLLALVLWSWLRTRRPPQSHGAD
jgi:heme A synthase